MDAKPFVKWAGGKRSLVDVLLPKLNISTGANYYEPFIGGGAVFFAVRRYRSEMRAILSDTNSELVTAYNTIRDHVEMLILRLRNYSKQHSEKFYYDVRAKQQPISNMETTVRFLYLNRAGFNGLYRVNQSGGFNVPWGKYESAVFDEDNLRAASKALRNTIIEVMDFEAQMEHPRAGDVVYFDPPYVPVSKTANFTAYSKIGFTDEHQIKLANTFRRLAHKGVRCVLSNADTPRSRELYADLNIQSVQVGRAINSDGAKRGKVGEIIVTCC